MLTFTCLPYNSFQRQIAYYYHSKGVCLVFVFFDTTNVYIKKENDANNDFSSNNNVNNHKKGESSCYGCGKNGHEAWECGNHVTFEAWRKHYETMGIKYTLKTTKALHLQLEEPHIPVRSPHNLIQECVYPDPWKVLVCCMCLNATSGRQTRPIMLRFFDKFPTPQSVVDADLQEITEIIKPLGLWKKRPLTLQEMSKAYLETEWTTPNEIFGVGKYANDAYLIFCCGKWRDVQPHDHMLNHYVKFISELNGVEYKEAPKVKRGRGEVVESKFFKKTKLDA